MTSGGFLPSEIEVIHGAGASEKLRGNTGRSGLAHLAMRFAESIGMPNDETTIKNEYADGLRNGQLLVAVLAPTEERRRLAGRILEEHGRQVAGVDALAAWRDGDDPQELAERFGALA